MDPIKLRFSCAALGVCFGGRCATTPTLKGRTREIEGRLAEAALHRVLQYFEIFAVHALADVWTMNLSRVSRRLAMTDDN